MHAPANQKLTPLVLGTLPTDVLKALGFALPAGDVWFSIGAQKHAIKRHPDDYPLCMPHLGDVVANPTHVGQSPHHSDGFELVRDTGGIIVLLGVLFAPGPNGLYIATTTYPLKRDTLERRVRKKHLLGVQ